MSAPIPAAVPESHPRRLTGFSSRFRVVVNIMMHDAEETFASSLSWPLSDSVLAHSSHDLSWKQPLPASNHPKGVFQDESLVDFKGVAGAIPESYIPSKSKFRDHQLSHQSRLSPVQEAGNKPTNFSSELSLGLAQFTDAWGNGDGPFPPEVRLRGGGGQDQGGKFEWLKTARTLNKTADKSRSGSSSSAVTCKGKAVGPPQPAPALNVLPPASRFARGPKNRAAATIARPSFDKINGDLTHDALNLPVHHKRSAAYLVATPLPPPPALLATSSRPATSNPFAGIYGNPYAIRATPTSPKIDYEVAGSLVNRPSALDGSQTGYDSKPKSKRRYSPAQTSHDGPGSVQVLQQVRTDRKWDALPPLPLEEGSQKLHADSNNEVEKRGVDDERFDTEEVLSSLRPERLSLHYIATPKRPVDGTAVIDTFPAANTEQPVPSTIENGESPTFNADVALADSYSVRTRDWDLCSCNTDDLGIDTRLKRQEQLAKQTTQYLFLQDQQRKSHIRYENEALDGLPEEDASTPESWFYAELIEIVNDYHEQLQRIVQSAYEAGEISEEHWLREKWTYRTAMDRKLCIAEEMSGYKILTHEADIKEAIKEPTGYAIYSSLLKIRDAETWQRIFEPTTTYSHLGTITSKLQKHSTAQEDFLVWLLRKIGRALRYMLNVPDDPDLKTYSSRHLRPPFPNTMTFPSKIGTLGPNIPSRPLGKGNPKGSASATTLQASLSKSCAPRDQPGRSNQSERMHKPSTDTTRINDNTTFTGETLTSPLNHRVVMAPCSRGYEDGAFVTIVAPSMMSIKSEKTTAGYGAGKLTTRQRVKDDVTEVTAWPEVGC